MASNFDKAHKKMKMQKKKNINEQKQQMLRKKEWNANPVLFTARERTQ